VGGAVRRRRSCPDCGERFTTHERRDPEPAYVVKRDGSRQRFDAEKLRGGLRRAAHKRPVRRAQIDELVQRIHNEIESSGGEMPSEHVRRLCLEGLGDLDAGAYLQFAGVELSDLDAVREHLDEIGENPANRGQTETELRPTQRARFGVTPKRRNRGDG
jgi:transcriptional repressor NrdR